MNEEGRRLEASREGRWAVPVAWICVALGLVLGLYGADRLAFDPDGFSLGNLSSLGSFLQGAVASLWSLGALLFIYRTFLAQEQQLRRQDEELEDQKKQFQLQHESIKKQSFESSFFQLLNLHIQVTAQMQMHGGHSELIYTGKKCFEDWHNQLMTRFREQNPTEAQTRDREFAINCYLGVYGTWQGNLAHYCRNLYHLIKFVAESDDIQDKRRYTSLVRAQLSAHELILIYYNGLTPINLLEGEKIDPSDNVNKFKTLAEEFGFFENLNPNLLMHLSHVNFYSPRAFK